tara:strand:- start:928 stop:1251 length:324 start_codon:yes stop_codon:yes gene_type:complete
VVPAIGIAIHLVDLRGSGENYPVSGVADSRIVLNLSGWPILRHRCNTILHPGLVRIHLTLVDDLAIGCLQYKIRLALLGRFALIAAIILGILLDRSYSILRSALAVV